MKNWFLGLACTFAVSGAASAQTTDTATPPADKFAIMDNSFLVEEAFNQEAGIFQNILGATRVSGRWASSFTQEWPVVSQTHQFSYTVPWLDAGTGHGIGDVLLNYRYQATLDGPGTAAFSPRLSVILPSGRAATGHGDGSAGLQVNLPFSKPQGDIFWHWNGGVTWLPRARALESVSASDDRRENLISPLLAASGIYRLAPMFHPMLETVLAFDEQVEGAGGTSRGTSFTLSPGFRGGWNLRDHQLIVGVAVPITWSGGDADTGTFLYLSYELPFQK